jgi:D-alanyl-D-alanine carboxypeptidase/D-alanyl-D-alanine-endopeptidase (penicillin-binding protein 4)
VRRVAGPVLVDDRAFRGPESNPHWPADDLDEGYAAATSAVSLDQDTVEFRVTPGAPGDAARVTIEPPNANVEIDGTIATGYPADPHIDRRPAPRGKPVRRNVFDVSGTVAPGPQQRYWKPVLGMPSYVAGAIRALLAERGIAASGAQGVGPAPLAAQTLWLHRSLPLAGIVTEMLVNSNNHSAEQLLRLLGERSAHVGTDAAGLAAERAELEHLGLDPGQVRAYDGSGLSPADKVSPRTLARLLAAVLRGPSGATLLRALPRVGFEGTVLYHDLGHARGRVRAKSGHLAGVNALAGTIATAHHGRVAFAFVVNDAAAQAAEVTEAQDRALDALADF